MTPYHLTMPENWTTGVLFASPHSGSYYPSELVDRSLLCRTEIRSSEDAYVDELFSASVRFGAPLLRAVYPRAYVDLNRDSDELDPALIRGAPPSRSNPRVASGLGVIPRVVANGRAIFRGKISLEEAFARIDNVWHPYHEKLAELIDHGASQFGQMLLLDCHSMPHEALHGTVGGNGIPDVVLGDRYGTTAASEFMDVVEAAFAAVGFRVARNTPFAGAFTTQRYGKPSRNRHAIQIEVDRSLYMDEQTLKRRPEFTQIQQAITHALGEICIYCQRPSMPLAAE